MLDENLCFTCGKQALENGLYCSAECRLQDIGDTSASYSSFTPSSPSTSPRESPLFGPQKSVSRTHLQSWSHHKSSHRSSPDTSPSLPTSDVPDLSDDDVYMNHPKLSNATIKIPDPRSTIHDVLSNDFWVKKGARPTSIPSVSHGRRGQSSKSMPHPVALNYVRKPGPINSKGIYSGPLSQQSPFEHHRAISEQQIDFVLPSGVGFRKEDQYSSGSGLSSTPKSKNAFRTGDSSRTTSKTTLPGSGSQKRPSGIHPLLAERHVSDTQVHSLHQSNMNKSQLMSRHASSPTTPSINRAYNYTLTKLSNLTLERERLVTQSQRTNNEFDGFAADGESDANSDGFQQGNRLSHSPNQYRTQHLRSAKNSPVLKRKPQEYGRNSAVAHPQEWSDAEKGQIRESRKIYRPPTDLSSSEARRGRSRQRV